VLAFFSINTGFNLTEKPDSQGTGALGGRAPKCLRERD
jgi:hypothetical protein